MKPVDEIENVVKKMSFQAGPEMSKDLWTETVKAQDEFRKTILAPGQNNIWRTIMKTKTVRFATAAAIALVVIGGITFWPNQGPDSKKWWLAPSAAWGQEILTVLDTVKSVTCREQTALVEADGSVHPSSTWNILYVSRDSYRRDIHDGSALREIQWYVPDGAGTLQHGIRFDLNSYFAHTGEGSFGNYDPVDRMRFYVGLLDEADRLLGEDVINGHQCVGFEISASKYGNNPAEWMDCIWFDVETKLPVCIEQRGRPVTGHADKTFTTVQDQFDYDPGLSDDTFIPYTPEGFVFGHPDDIQATNEK